jgi:hypothetical protein
MAPGRQASWQGAGSQWRQRLGNPSPIKPAPTWTRERGRGVSMIAVKSCPELEWAVAQAGMHCMQPTQRSG